MKRNTIVLVFALLSVTTVFSQKNKEKVNELLTSFQINLVEGLDLSSFDTIPDLKIKKIKIDAFINLCKSKGGVAQIYARSIIESKTINNSLSDDEMLIIIYDNYKANIPELKKSYLDYIRSKRKIKEKKDPHNAS